MDTWSEIDFSLGSIGPFDSDVSEADIDVSEADFSLGLDLSDLDNEQVGGGQAYTIQLVKERLIRKFDVHGYDYHVHIEAFERDTDFTVAVQVLHGILTGGYHYNTFLLHVLPAQCTQLNMFLYLKLNMFLYLQISFRSSM